MGRKQKKISAKPCDRCGEASDRLIRARADEAKCWQLVCNECWPELQSSPSYQYGGLWRSVKRR